MDKGHGKLVRRRLKSVSHSPQESGLCGCWRFIAVEHVTIDLTKPKHQQTQETEIAYYASSHTEDERGDATLLELIVGHWDTIKNGVHRVRNCVTLCNLAIGLYQS